MQNLSRFRCFKAQYVLGLLAILLLVGGAADVQAQTGRENGNRIDRLEKEIQTLSRALFRGETPPAGSLSSGASDNAAQANAEIRLNQLETELRSIRGQLEEQSFAMRELRVELDRMKGDLEMRVNDLEGNSGVSPSGNGGAQYINRVTPQSGVVNPADVPSTNRGSGYQWDSGANDSSTPSSAGSNQLGTYVESVNDGVVSGNNDLAAATYENAFALLKAEKYDSAQKEFDIFLAQYPDHVLAGNAKYWLGETYYVRGNYEKSARLFAEGFKLYPKNSKSADNLLKLGMSLAALDKTGDACVALSQIEKEGYQASAPVLRRANQEKTRLGC